MLIFLVDCYFEPLDYLKTEDDFRLALQAAFEVDPGDGSLIAATLGDIAKARGMTQPARDTDLARESLYHALSGKGNPEFATVLKVMRVLGVEIVPKSFRWQSVSL